MLNGKIQVKIDSFNSTKGFFEAETKISWTAPEEKKPKDKKSAQYSLPQIQEIYKENWGSGIGIDSEEDTAILSDTPEGKILFVNMDCKILVSQLSKTPNSLIVREKTMWQMICLLSWINFYNLGEEKENSSEEESKKLTYEDVKKVLNKSLIGGGFPLVEVVRTLYVIDNNKD